MRSLMMLAVLVPLLAACGTPEEDHDAAAAATNYTPPTVTSRLDYGSEIERRFHRFDVNGDDKITADELPARLRRVVARGDTNKDGALGPEEWSNLMLDWFDRNDLNKDGTLTTEERETYRERRRAARGAAPDQAAR
jgi:hypothetical protein